jgi:hypothetical protein
MLPSISAGHTKRIVRDGRGNVPFLINAFNVRAVSRMDTQPDALSLAPGRG